MADEADLFDNDAQRKKKFLNVSKDSEDEIDFDEFDMIDLNITSFTRDWDRPGGKRCCLQSKIEWDNIVDNFQ